MILGKSKADIFNIIPNWKSIQDVVNNQKLIDIVIEAGKKTAEKYKDKL